MKTVEERIKDLKKLAMIYLFLGIVWAVFLIVAEKTGWVNFRGDERDRYYLGLDGGDESFSQCSLNKMDFKLPYKVFNFLSVKDGVLTELISCDAGKEIDLRAFHPIYEVVDDNFIVFRDRIKNKSYLSLSYEGTFFINAWNSAHPHYLYRLQNRLATLRTGRFGNHRAATRDAHHRQCSRERFGAAIQDDIGRSDGRGGALSPA